MLEWDKCSRKVIEAKRIHMLSFLMLPRGKLYIQWFVWCSGLRIWFSPHRWNVNFEPLSSRCGQWLPGTLAAWMAPFCSWRGTCQSCPCSGSFVKADDFGVPQPLFKHNFEIRLLSFAVFSFRIAMKPRCKQSRCNLGSSWHAQQRKYNCLLVLKVKNKWAQWVRMGQPLCEASGWCFQAPESVWFFLCTYICLCISIYIYICTNPYSAVPEHWTEDWQSATCQNGFGEVHDVILTWVNHYSPKRFLGMIQD